MYEILYANFDIIFYHPDFPCLVCNRKKIKHYGNKWYVTIHQRDSFCGVKKVLREKNIFTVLNLEFILYLKNFCMICLYFTHYFYSMIQT